MSDTFKAILDLIERKEIVISNHGYDELADDHIFVRDILAGIKEAIVVENYSEYSKGPCVLLLQKDTDGEPIHVVWGIRKGAISPAVLVTPIDQIPMYGQTDTDKTMGLLGLGERTLPAFQHLLHSTGKNTPCPALNSSFNKDAFFAR